MSPDTHLLPGVRRIVLADVPLTGDVESHVSYAVLHCEFAFKGFVTAVPDRRSIFPIRPLLLVSPMTVAALHTIPFVHHARLSWLQDSLCTHQCTHACMSGYYIFQSLPCP
ncbi:hypothetical protein PAXRUDRAFT_835276, partial [Paxillus rubicundulus Ve08.2h10]